MRILHTEASSGWGGQEIRILREAEGMRARGHTVLLAVQKGGGLVRKAKEAGFAVYEMSFKRGAWPLTLLRLLSIFWRERVEILNTHSSLDSWIGGIAGRLWGLKIVRTRHLSTPIKAGWNSRMVYGRLADFVVTTCASIVPMICRQAGKEGRCRSIATGVDPRQIRVDEEAVREFRRGIGGDMLVGTACFMRSWKGIDDLLMAADRLRGVQGLKWVVIGGGHAERHHRKAKELQLEGVVYFTGHLDSPFSALAALDVFALLSTAHEGVSQAILQAAYLGKPLIATDVGGLGEVCSDGVTGCIVPPFSPEKVAEAVLRLKKDPAWRLELGQNGRKRVEEKFLLSHTLAQMEEVYTQYGS